MFKFLQPKVLDPITVFHRASSPASMRVATLLKQVAGNAAAGATQDQASDHTAQTHRHRKEFELHITEDPPTTDQLKTILEYVGASGIPSIVQGAQNEGDALRKFQMNPNAFQRPVVVDWNHGKATAGDNESEILKMLDALHGKDGK